METLSLKQLTDLLRSKDVKGIPRKSIFLRKLAASATLISVDLLCIALAMFSSLYLRDVMMPASADWGFYSSVISLVLPLFTISFYLKGLYPGFGIDVIDELRSVTYSISVVYALLAGLTFLVKDGEFSRFMFIMSWGASLFILPFGRSIIRKFLACKSWWGIPVIIIGAGKTGETIITSLKKHSYIGLRPVVAVDDDIDRWGYIDSIPVIGGLDVIPEISSKLRVDHAIIAMPKVDSKKQEQIIKKYSNYFTRVTVIPNLFGLSSLWVSTRDFGGILGLEVQQKLLRKSALMAKRLFDIIISGILGITVLPLVLFISVLIWLDSKGSIFFKQERMGKDDTRFKIVKFRTMHIDAEQRLSDLLDKNPAMKREYDIYHKLKDDPRLTRVGKILRKFSLDELPQFINVIKGEMSLIGPRAYMPWEKEKMNGHDEMILKVKPGISGLWQVTDRNASSFEERNLTDVYYIRNWSMFLDFYIFMRTISVIVTGNSGY